jgi:hypothetical protein
VIIEELIERLTERQQSEFALKCARRVQHVMTDPRSIEALDTRDRWLRGEANDAELYSAQISAGLAAKAAKKGETNTASANSASAAEWAARGAAFPTAWVCANFAKSYAAETCWQRDELQRMLAEGGGA